jgi:hypothetical protein
MNRYDSRARAERAFGLRAVGRTWQEIADALGYKSRGAAQDAVRRHMDRTAPDSPEAARRSALESLRITSATLFGAFSAAATRRDDKALAALNAELARNRDQFAKLTGAYQPERAEVEVAVMVQQTPADLLAEYEAKLLAFVDAVVIEQKELPR